MISIALLEAAGQGIFNVRHLRCHVFLCSQAGPTMPLAIQEAGNLVSSATKSLCCKTKSNRAELIGSGQAIIFKYQH